LQKLTHQEKMTDLKAVVFAGQDGESKTEDMEGQQTNQPGFSPVNLETSLHDDYYSRNKSFSLFNSNHVTSDVLKNSDKTKPLDYVYV